MKINKIKEQKIAVISRGDGGIGKHLPKSLCFNYVKRLYKSFGGVQS